MAKEEKRESKGCRKTTKGRRKIYSIEGDNIVCYKRRKHSGSVCNLLEGDRGEKRRKKSSKKKKSRKKISTGLLQEALSLIGG